MKKILLSLVLVCFLAVLAMPIFAAPAVPTEIGGCTMRHDFSAGAWADRGFVCPSSGRCEFTATTSTCGSCCAIDIIYVITDWVFIIVLSLSVIFILIGAYNIMSAGGEEKKITTGRQYILWALIGLLIAAMAKVAPSFMANIIK